jgi:hypothetical protein
MLVVLAACGQSRRQAWQTICEAPRGQAADVAAWMRDHVTNREAQHDINSLGAIEREADRRAIIVAILDEVGIAASDCAFLDAH